MESNWLTKNKRTLALVIILTLAAWMLYNVRRDLMSTLSPFIYAAVFAYLLNPLINLLERRGIKRFWSSLLTVLIIFFGLIAFFSVFIPTVVSDVTTVIRRLSLNMGTLRRLFDEAVAVVEGWFGGNLNAEGRLSDMLNAGISALSEGLTRILGSLNSLIDIFLIPVITFYLLKDKDLLLRDISSTLREPQRGRIQEVGRGINRLLSGYVKGKLLISFFIGVFTGLGCMLIGLPNALTIGIVAALFDLIPYFGPYLGGMLPILIALIGPTPIKALWVVILIVVIQQVESNLITPRVLSERVGLHPLVVMFSVMFFGSVMGIPGMILGVPIMAVLLAVIQAAINWDRKAEKKEEPQEAAAEPAPANPGETP
jgi:predicted PurR-regulated permease PerM